MGASFVGHSVESVMGATIIKLVILLLKIRTHQTCRIFVVIITMVTYSVNSGWYWATHSKDIGHTSTVRPAPFTEVKKIEIESQSISTIFVSVLKDLKMNFFYPGDLLKGQNTLKLIHGNVSNAYHWISKVHHWIMITTFYPNYWNFRPACLSDGVKNGWKMGLFILAFLFWS